MTTNSSPPIIALIVTFNPDLNVLARLVDSIVPQVDRVVLVDNDVGARVTGWLRARGDNARIVHLPLGENLGIAAAQNAGIAWAKQQGAGYVLFFDQDSIPSPDMVARLWAVMQDRENACEKIAAVGPRFVNKRIPEQAQPPHFVHLRGWRFRRVECSVASKQPVRVDFLISSGSLFPLAVFDDIGGMNEALFIDHVDTEFSLRLKKAGYRSYGFADAVMHHEIGDDSCRFFDRHVALHSPLRHYYIIRNAVWIICQPWMAPSWRMALGFDTVQRFIFYALFARPRREHISMMLRGARDALRGRMGRL